MTLPDLYLITRLSRPSLLAFRAWLIHLRHARRARRWRIVTVNFAAPIIIGAEG